MFCSHTVSAQDDDDIILMRIVPDLETQELPCAAQIIVYECRVSSSFTLTWILPNDVVLEFNSEGEENNTMSDGTTIATLIEMIPVGGSRFLYTSTLLIQDTIDMSSLTCVGATGLTNPTAETTIGHSG